MALVNRCRGAAIERDIRLVNITANSMATMKIPIIELRILASKRENLSREYEQTRAIIESSPGISRG